MMRRESNFHQLYSYVKLLFSRQLILIQKRRKSSTKYRTIPAGILVVLFKPTITAYAYFLSSIWSVDGAADEPHRTRRTVQCSTPQRPSEFNFFLVFLFFFFNVDTNRCLTAVQSWEDDISSPRALFSIYDVLFPNKINILKICIKHNAYHTATPERMFSTLMRRKKKR